MAPRPAPILDSGLKAAVAAAGSRARLAAMLGVSAQAVDQWTRVPYERILEIERLTGVPRETLRPELYRKRKST